MKTPFSFLGRLLARGRTAEPQALLSPPAEKAKIDDKNEASALQPAVSDIIVDASSEDVAKIEASVPEVVVALPDPDAPAIVSDVISSSADESRLLPKLPRVKRASRAKAEASQPRAEARHEDRTEPSRPLVTDALSEEAQLDMEIAGLRTQLAQKLRLQNAQLKKRLERFERS